MRRRNPHGSNRCKKRKAEPDKTFYAQRLVGAGGMPSSHTSMVISALLTVGRKDGTGSTAFALMFIMGAIVIYDAMGVRRAAGLHAREINKLKESVSEKDENGKPLIMNGKKLMIQMKLRKYYLHIQINIIMKIIIKKNGLIILNYYLQNWGMLQI